MVVAKKSKIGMGLFARSNFSKGDIVAEVKGKVVTELNPGYNYYIDFGDGEAVDPAEPCCFINHCCDPNCAFYIYGGDESGEPKQLVIEALRNIKANEELSVDYSWPSESAIPCECGSPHCRGWIIDKSELKDMDEAEAAYPVPKT